MLQTWYIPKNRWLTGFHLGCTTFTLLVRCGFHDSSKRIADFIATCDLESCRRKSFYEPVFFLPPPTCPRERLNHDECGGQLKVLALITARGGSKGIPHKNIVELNGKPLIQYTIDAALGSKSLDRVILSTDCEEISTVAKSLGCEVPFIRPSELAQDNSTHRSAVIHALDYLREKEGYVPDYLLFFNQLVSSELVKILTMQFPSWKGRSVTSS